MVRNMLGEFLEFLLIIFLVLLGIYFVEPTIIANMMRTFSGIPAWRSLALALFQRALCFDSPGVSQLNIIELNFGDIYVVAFWLLTGLLFGYRHKSIKNVLIIGLITPLATAQVYIMMLQQYTPDLWNSFSPKMQETITHTAYMNGLQLSLVLIAGLLAMAVVRKIKMRKPMAIYIIPEEEKKPLLIKCPACRKVHYSNARFCSNCGTPMAEKVETTEETTI